MDICIPEVDCYQLNVDGEVHGPFQKRLDVHDRAYDLCKQYLGGKWGKITRNEFQVCVLGGGLTNKLYICQLPKYHRNGVEDKGPHTVLLRLFGLIIQDFTAQIQESVVFSILSERKIGPHLYAVFPGGRLEEFIPCRTLSTLDLPDPVTSRQIAQRMARYHRMNMPMGKEPTGIMNKLQLYFEGLERVHFEDHNKAALFEQFLELGVEREFNFVKDLVRKSGSPVVFCHNDVQEGNLLHNGETCEGENPIQMIDFEYSCYNYRGFDIANHFCEWMYDYSHQQWPFFSYRPEDHPNRQQRINFIQSYLDEHYAISHVCNQEKWQIDFVLKEAERFALLSHLFWALWSIMQAKVSDIGFGYMEYALARMNAYFHKKAELE